MIRIFIVDDDWNAREGLKDRFEDVPDFEVIGLAENGEEALEKLTSLTATACPPQVAILDVNLPGELSGPKLAEEIRTRGWTTRILAYSASIEDEKVAAMVDAGALGYYVKGWGSTLADIITAIRTVMEGNPWFSSVLDEWVQNRLHPKEEELTPRQVEILQLAEKGLKNKAIALMLKCSEKNIEAHLGRIYQALNAINRTQAVSLAKDRGLI